MSKSLRFDPREFAVALDHELCATLIPDRPDPQVPVHGMTFGVASMSQNAPHGGERHADGDEVLYLISGRVRIVLLDPPGDEILLNPGDGLVVSQGTWHRVDVLEPCQLVYLTPGPNNAFKPLPVDA